MLAVTNTAKQYTGIATTYLWVGLAVFAIIAVVTVTFLWRFRARPGREHKTSAKHEHTKLEMAYVLGLVAITVVLVWLTFSTETREDNLVNAKAPADAVHIDVVGAQWNWRFVYPGSPPVQQVNAALQPTTMYVPAGQVVAFRGWSQDVLHDFWVPSLRFQRQVWPGHVERWNLVFPHPGRYQGVCAWFCGLYHERMDFTVLALEPAAFRRWLASRRTGAPA